MGNTGDPRLAVYLEEQWFLVLHGTQPWRNPPFFFPTKGVLGYTDTEFLWQVVFAPLRAVGADPFLAYQLGIVILSLTAFGCLVAFTRIVFRSSMLVSSLAAFACVFANNLSAHTGSPQMFAVYFVPPILLAALFTWRWRSTRPLAAAILGELAAFALALVLFSDYYVGWFTLFTAVVVLVLALAVAPRRGWRVIRETVTMRWKALCGACLAFGIGLVPFLVTYLPVAKIVGARTYSDALSYAPRWNDLVNVTTGNLLWGHLFHLWNGPPSTSYEESYALTPVLMVSVVVGGAVLVAQVLRRRRTLNGATRFTLALCLTSIVLLILPVDTRSGSLWLLVWHLPGADAIRAVDRLQALNDLVASLALVGLATQLQRRLPISSNSRVGRGLRAAGLGLLLVIAAEQIHDTSGNQLRRSAELAALSHIPKPPNRCVSFYVSDSVPNTVPYYAFQTEAMLISQRTGLPTLNGWSGNNPPGWEFEDPNSASYLAAVQVWVRTHGLISGVCDLDLGTTVWRVGLGS